MEIQEQTLLFLVDKRGEGKRLDIYLFEHPESPSWSRSRVQQLIRRGNVRLSREFVNQRVFEPSIKTGILLRTGDQIQVEIPPPEPVDALPEKIPLDVLYEDGDLIIINKPPGLVVHPAAGHSQGTLVNALLAHIPDLSGIGGKLRPGIVHRLDKDTSGLMVAAKNERTLKSLQVAIKKRLIGRFYWALAWGKFPDEGRIDGDIGRNPRHRKKMAVVESGKPALTYFRVLESFVRRALLEVRLESGRTHQIRVHLAHRGTPVIGDKVYGVFHQGDPVMDRQALHAYRLKFDHPATGKTLVFEAEPPEDFQGALDFLREKIPVD